VAGLPGRSGGVFPFFPVAPRLGKGKILRGGFWSHLKCGGVDRNPVVPPLYGGGGAKSWGVGRPPFLFFLSGLGGSAKVLPGHPPVIVHVFFFFLATTTGGGAELGILPGRPRDSSPPPPPLTSNDKRF